MKMMGNGNYFMTSVCSPAAMRGAITAGERPREACARGMRPVLKSTEGAEKPSDCMVWRVVSECARHGDFLEGSGMRSVLLGEEHGMQARCKPYKGLRLQVTSGGSGEGVMGSYGLEARQDGQGDGPM